MTAITRILSVVLFLHLSGETEKNHAECSGFLLMIEKVTSVVQVGDGTLSSQWRHACRKKLCFIYDGCELYMKKRRT